MPAELETADPLLKTLRSTLGGRFDILGQLGHGGMGRVYLAEDTALQRRIAIKVMDPELETLGSARARFLREARAAAAISHPNIVSILETGKLSRRDVPYFVMPFVRGQTLEELFPEGTKGAESETKRVIGEIAAALVAAHKMGVVHRDVKPANVMVEEESRRVVVLDFGISAIGHLAPEMTRLTTTGMQVGTPQYMSPEQVNGDEVTGATDIYSLGCVAYRLLTGASPFAGMSSAAMMAAHLRDAPEPLRNLRPDVEPEFTELITRAMAKDPTRRPQAQEFVDLLLPRTAKLAWPPPGLETSHAAAVPAAWAFAAAAVIAGGPMMLAHAVPESTWIRRLLESPLAQVSRTLLVLALTLLGIAVVAFAVRAFRRGQQLGYTATMVWRVLLDARNTSGEWVERLASDTGVRRARSELRRTSLAWGTLMLAPLIVSVAMLASTRALLHGLGEWGALAPLVAALFVLGWALPPMRPGWHLWRAFRRFRRGGDHHSGESWRQTHDTLSTTATVVELRPHRSAFSIGLLAAVAAFSLLVMQGITFAQWRWTSRLAADPALPGADSELAAVWWQHRVMALGTPVTGPPLPGLDSRLYSLLTAYPETEGLNAPRDDRDWALLVAALDSGFTGRLDSAAAAAWRSLGEHPHRGTYAVLGQSAYADLAGALLASSTEPVLTAADFGAREQALNRYDLAESAYRQGAWAVALAAQGSAEDAEGALRHLVGVLRLLWNSPVQVNALPAVTDRSAELLRVALRHRLLSDDLRLTEGWIPAEDANALVNAALRWADAPTLSQRVTAALQDHHLPTATRFRAAVLAQAARCADPYSLRRGLRQETAAAVDSLFASVPQLPGTLALIAMIRDVLDQPIAETTSATTASAGVAMVPRLARVGDALAGGDAFQACARLAAGLGS